MYTDEKADLKHQLSAAAPTTRRRRSMTSIFIAMLLLDTLVLGGLILGVLVFPPMAEAFSPLFCAENTTLTTIKGASSSESGTTFLFHCLNDDLQMVSDVTGQVVLVIIGAGIGIFALGGLSLFISYAATPKAIDYTGIAPALQNPVAPKTPMDRAMAEAMEKIQHDALTPADMAQLSEMFGILVGRDAPFVRVTGRLAQLKESCEARLITLTEYHQKREEILREFPEYQQN